MNAREMFEELGYHISKNDDEYLFYDKPNLSLGDSGEQSSICFYKTNKPKNGYIPHYMTSRYRNSACGLKKRDLNITSELHQAITQQMKELG